MEGLIWINENLQGSMFVNEIFKVITMFGEMGAFWIVLSLLMLIFEETRTCAIVMIVSLVLGFVFNDFVLKNIFARERPFIVHPEFVDFLKSIKYDLPSGFSLPSGHAYSSFNCAVVITCFHKKLGYIVLPLAFLIAISRIFLCVHYPTDVLLGAMLGIITAIVVVFVYRKIDKKIKGKQRVKIRLRINHDKN